MGLRCEISSGSSLRQQCVASGERIQGIVLRFRYEPHQQRGLRGLASPLLRRPQLPAKTSGVQFNRYLRDIPKPAPNHVWKFETCRIFYLGTEVDPKLAPNLLPKCLLIRLPERWRGRQHELRRRGGRRPHPPGKPEVAVRPNRVQQQKENEDMVTHGELS